MAKNVYNVKPELVNKSNKDVTDKLKVCMYNHFYVGDDCAECIKQRIAYYDGDLKEYD